MQNDAPRTPDEHASSAIPPTPGQAEGSENPGRQSQASPAPQQTDQAEGEPEDGEETRSEEAHREK